jgi:glycine/serine hydroxymethyltransferase
MKGQEVYFYQGIEFIRDIEKEAQQELSRFFGCSEVELRPVSGQMANEVVFKAMVRFLNRDRPDGQPMRKMRLVMNNALNRGGHLSSQPMGALFNFVEEDPETGKEKVVNFPVLEENPYKPDPEKLAELMDRHKPELVIFGKSMFIYQEPIQFVANMVKDWDDRPVIMYDMAHVLGLYGVFQEPLAEGADVITGSTHKTFLGTLLALLMAAYEMNQFKQEYQTQVRKNAKAFASSLKEKGIPVEGDEKDGFTQTHQVLIRIKEYGNGMDIAQKLEENNILTNYQALPDDETFLEPSGIRMGVQEMTRFGMTEKDFDVLSGFVADVILENRNVREEVRAFRQNFLEMKYCLPAQESIQAAAEIFQSIFSHPGFSEMFIKSAENIIMNPREGR